eukprot:158971_1
MMSWIQMLTLLLCSCLFEIKTDSSFMIHVNASNKSTKQIWNPWSTENSADYTDQWINTANIDKTNPNIHSQYPFFTHQKFAYATGGCYKGFTDSNNKTCTVTFDLLQDTSNANSPYNFTQLHIGIDNVLTMGLKPYLVTGLIPVSYSFNPTLSKRGFNEVPPSNYTKYADYIYELAKYLLNIYGIDEIQKWWFGVITEYNNINHFYDINNPNDTMRQYFMIYDYTECSLKKAFGNNFTIGAHSCRTCATAWNSTQLLNHIANQNNFCTGKQNDTKLDFWSVSFYENAPGNPGDQSTFDDVVCSMHNEIKKYNLEHVVKDIAIDEGRILFDQNGKGLVQRAVGRTYQASWDSLLFYNMIRCNISRFIRWGVNTNGLGLYVNTQWNAVNTVQTVGANVAQLMYKMDGNVFLGMDVEINMNGKVENKNENIQIVNGMGGISNDGIVRVFVFNHNSEYFSTQTANVSVNVCDIRNNGNEKCNVIEWMIDDEHAQFWNIYWNDVIERNITKFCPVGWS